MEAPPIEVTLQAAAKQRLIAAEQQLSWFDFGSAEIRPNLRDDFKNTLSCYSCRDGPVRDSNRSSLDCQRHSSCLRQRAGRCRDC